MKHWIATIVLLITGGCAGSDEVEIRFLNGSDRTFDSLEVAFGHSLEFVALAPDAATDYHRFDHAYDFGYARAVIAGEEFVQQPIDFVGERELEPGRYTYTLTLVGGPGSSQLTGSMTRDD